MAATNYTPIQLYFSTTASAVPLAANLAQGELAINITDGKLYYEDNGGVVQVLATKGAGTIGGSTTQIQYNNAGALAGNAAMVFNNSTNVTTLTTLNLTNALGATYGGTAQSAYTQGDVLYASATNTLSKLGIGTVNYILTSTGSVPQWVAPTSVTVNTATNLAGGAAGSVPYQSGVATTTFLAIGAANRVMTSSGTAPQWVTSLTGLTGVSSSSITNTSLTSGRVIIASTAGLEADSANLTFDGTTLSSTGYSTTGLSTLVKTVKIGDSSFNGVAVFAAATPAKLYMGTGTVTDVTSAISATNAIGAIASLGITPIAATNTSVTYTNASTLYIAGAPSAGTNVTITNPYSMYVAAGAAYFGGAVTVAGTISLAGVTVTSLTDSGLTSGRVTYATTGGLLTDSANLLYAGADLTVYGVRVGRGANAVATATVVGFQAANSNTGANLTAVGYQAAYANLAGANTTAFGLYALKANTSGDSNTGVGSSVLQLNDTGAYNTAVGTLALAANTSSSNSTAVGYQAGQTNTGAQNTYIGSSAAVNATSGSNNTALGYSAGLYTRNGSSNTALGANTLGIPGAGYMSGSNNTAVGAEALYSQLAASGNTAVGYQAAYSNTSGGVTAVGAAALKNNVSGQNLTAVGVGALQANTANNNTAVGYAALTVNVSNTYLTALGYYALVNATADRNTGLGYQAGYAITTGGYNTAVGSQAMGGTTRNVTGTDNIAIGAWHDGVIEGPLANLGTGSYNIAIGNAAMRLLNTGNYNVALGQLALTNNANSNSNTAIGDSALANTTAASNTALGSNAGYTNNTGANNVFVGQAAGFENTSGTQGVFLGFRAGRNFTTPEGTIAIGYEAGYNGGVATHTGGYNMLIGGTISSVQNPPGYSLTTGSTNMFIGNGSGQAVSSGNTNLFVGYRSGDLMTTGNGNTIIGRFSGNQGGLDIRTSSNNIVLSDGDGNPRLAFDGNGQIVKTGTANAFNSTIDSVQDFDAASRFGFNGLANNNDGIFFGTGINNGIPSGIAFYREGAGWNTAIGFFTNYVTSGPESTSAMQQKLLLTSSGALSLFNGDKAPGGTGICFPASQDPSSNANTLDDYEEGTWTPALSGDSGSSGVTYSTQIGRYTKIGNQVTCWFAVTLTNKGTLVGGTVGITNNPFTPAAYTQMDGMVDFDSLATNWIVVGCKAGGFSYLRGRNSASTSYSYLAPADIANNTTLVGSFTYQV